MKLNLYVQGFGQTFHIEINSESSVRDLKNLILKRVNERLSDDFFMNILTFI